MKRRTVFLDRDGVINRCAPPHQYIQTWEEFQFLPGVADAIGALNRTGYLVLIVTNQRGIARGRMTTDELSALHEKMQGWLREHGAHVDAIYVCPHETGTCNCRKPDIGLFLQAEAEWPIGKETTWMVGDSASDIQAGKKYGIKTALIGREDFGQDITCTGLPDAVERIIQEG